MADTQTSPAANGSAPITPQTNKPKGNHPPKLNKQQQLNKLYALPAPLRTFPLPTLVPHNPLSLFHLIYVWVSQTLNPTPAHFNPLYQGWFSAETRSVHVTDARSVRGVWEQGFYGKGSLSRSEPSWLNRETTKRGTHGKTTAEEKTRQRRAERQQTKWERARKEREAIDQKLQEEAEAAAHEPLDDLSIIEKHEISQVENDSRMAAELEEKSDPFQELVLESMPIPKMVQSPVGPFELLALPNSTADLEAFHASPTTSCTPKVSTQEKVSPVYLPPVGPLELLALPNKLPISPPLSPIHDRHIKFPSREQATEVIGDSKAADIKQEHEEVDTVGGSETNDDTAEGSTHSGESEDTTSTAPQRSALASINPKPHLLTREKSVRFSPMVEKTTFISSEPPNPEHAIETVPSVEMTIPAVEEDFLIIKNQEHTQLTLEEAFFLSYGLGALQILDPATKQVITNKALFKLFRQCSYFPPLAADDVMKPDDPFMINYAVYHHYRSLGWVPRSGIKFSVDLMLYVRGPVFTHAEYGVLILPSYSDPYWSSTEELRRYVAGKERRTWHWVSCVNRVITQVKKTLVLAYVDVPRPVDEEGLGVDEVLARYRVREVVLRRWVANRSRD